MRFLLVFIFALTTTNVHAQTTVGSGKIQPAFSAPANNVGLNSTNPAARNCCLVPAGTTLYLQLVDELSSKRNLRGDTFRIRLSDPIKVDGRIVVPAGTSGRGEVIDVARAGMGGKPGELVLAARYLTLGDRQIPLRGFKLGGHGVNNGAEAQTAILLFGAVGLAMKGGDMELSVGAEASAKIAKDIELLPSDWALPQDEKTQKP
jgi:hypothetical protein